MENHGGGRGGGKQPPTVLLVGDLTVDVVARVGSFSGLGGDYLTPSLELHCGGVALNTALGLTGWGLSARLVGTVGRDVLGEFLLQSLQGRGVDTRYIQRTPHVLTGFMFAVVTDDGERTFFGSRGANTALQLDRSFSGWLHGVQAVYLAGYVLLSRSGAASARRIAQEARRRSVPLFFDVCLSPAVEAPQAVLKVASRVDTLLVSQKEAATLTGTEKPRRALEALEEAGTKQVVIKLGDRGCLFRRNGRLRHVPAFPVTVEDTTGCGDAFAASFLRARLEGWPLEEAALLANAAGAAAAQVIGAGERAPRPLDVLGVLTQARLSSQWEATRHRVLHRLATEGFRSVQG